MKASCQTVKHFHCEIKGNVWYFAPMHGNPVMVQGQNFCGLGGFLSNVGYQSNLAKMVSTHKSFQSQ